jgi:hypothetical protein
MASREEMATRRIKEMARKKGAGKSRKKKGEG